MNPFRVPSLVRWLALLLCALTLGAAAREAQPLAQDPVLEAKVLAIAEELRCLVCQNESIAASHADLAVDLRQQIRQKLQQGESRDQIIDFMVERYGEFVLFRPAMSARNALLWAGPFVLLLVALVTLAINIRKRRRVAAALSTQDHERAQALLGQVDEGQAR